MGHAFAYGGNPLLVRCAVAWSEWLPALKPNPPFVNPEEPQYDDHIRHVMFDKHPGEDHVK